MKTRITNYIKSGYSGLYIVSYEESRVEASIRDVLTDLNATEELFNLCVWSITEGIVQVSKGGKPIAETQDPLVMLSHFMEAEEHTVYLLRDFHLFVEKPNAMLWRKVKDALSHAKSHMKTLVILGCRLCIPPELEKEITVLDFALPDRAQLKIILHSLLESNNRGPCEDEAGILNAAAGLTTIEAENAFALSIIETGKVLREVVYREKVAAVKKGGLLEVMESKLKLENIGGLDRLKAWLVEKKDQFLDCAADYGLPPPKGIVLVGNPGTGKSETAKACGSVFGIPILRLNAANLFASHVGESEANWRRTHATALAMAPCIVFIDEIDGIGGTGENLDSGVTDRLIKSILQDMEDHSQGIFYIGTCNDIDKIKAPLLQRFDEIWNVELPAVHEREQIFSIQIARVNRNPKDFDLKKLAANSVDFSGREIRKIVHSALSRAFADNRREPTTADFVSILEGFTPLSKTMAKDIEARRERLKGVARLASSPTVTTGKAVTRKISTFAG